MARIKECPAIPESKAIKVGRNSYTPTLLYGSEKSSPAPIKATDDKIIFVDGKFTPKSIEVQELMEVFADTGNLISRSTLPLKIVKGDVVMVSEEGVEFMRESYSRLDYWMLRTSDRVFTVTDFFSSGTRCSCKYGILPPYKYLSLMSSSVKAGPISVAGYVARQDEAANIIVRLIDEKYGPYDPDELIEIKKDIVEAMDRNNGKLHGINIFDSQLSFLILSKKEARDYHIEYVQCLDEETLGYYSESFLEKVFPEMAGIFSDLNRADSTEEIWKLVKKLPNSAERIVEACYKSDGMSISLGYEFNHYDSQCYEFAFYGEKYYLLRQD